MKKIIVLHPMAAFFRIRNKFMVAIAGLCLLVSAACSPDMRDQPRYKPLGPSDLFADGRAARPEVQGTVARGQLRDDDAFYKGKVDGRLVETAPVEVTMALLERGRERFDIYCSPCHGRVGDGAGMIVRRGFRQPPSLHIDRLREAPDGYFYDVMTNGFGAMASYASRVAPRDRWAVTAYIRALQLSQGAKMEDVPPAERPKLTGASR